MLMKKIFFSLFLLTFIIALVNVTSCKKDDTSTKKGRIAGTVYSKNGLVKLGAVRVFLLDHPNITTLTDKNGYFLLEAPVGVHKLVIQSGNGHLFRTMLNVGVTENYTLQLTLSQTTLNQVGALAYIKGFYDRIETIIIDSLGYTATEIQVSTLDSMSILSNYQALFLNCGKSGMLDSLKYSNLQSYVNNCGSIYASDYAVEYLTGDGNLKGDFFRPKGGASIISPKQTNSCNPKIGGFITDSLLCTMKIGLAGYIDSVDIISPAIQTLLGKTKMRINYDLGGWEVIQQLGPQFTILLDDNTLTNYGPLAVLQHYGPSTCTQGGNILFTTFHNEPQTGVSSDVQQILQYFILNL